MTELGVNAGSESEAAVELFADLLRAEFDEKAVRVAELQPAAAQADMVIVWQKIINRLRG